MFGGAALVLVMVLAGCGDAEGTSPTTTTSPQASLPGTRWIVDGLTIDGEPYPLVADATIDFSADDAQVGGTTGCNSYFGAVDYGSPGQITIGQMGMTEMACLDNAVMDQERVFSQALPLVTVYQVEGDRLTLASGDGAVEITAIDREVAIPDAALDGTTWIADTIIVGDGASSMLAGTEVTMTIDVAAGEVHGNAGCNTFGGSVAVDGDTVAMGGLALTRMACKGDVMDQESLVVDILQAAARYSIDGNRLTIETDDDRGLGFLAG
jgi:heat shock protein HslJ